MCFNMVGDLYIESQNPKFEVYNLKTLDFRAV